VATRTDFQQQPGTELLTLWLTGLPDYIDWGLPGEFFWNTSLKRIFLESCSNLHNFSTYSSITLTTEYIPPKPSTYAPFGCFNFRLESVPLPLIWKVRETCIEYAPRGHASSLSPSPSLTLSKKYNCREKNYFLLQRLSLRSHWSLKRLPCRSLQVLSSRPTSFLQRLSSWSLCRSYDALSPIPKTLYYHIMSIYPQSPTHCIVV
jgi:hypothetical protein